MAVRLFGPIVAAAPKDLDCGWRPVPDAIPGRIETQRIKALDEAKAKREGRSIDDVATESAGSIPVGRYGKPEEYDDVVAFLASERAASITGSTLRVDDGLIASI